MKEKIEIDDARPRAEEDEEFYKLIFEKSTAPTIVVEADYIISKINERQKDLLGYSKEEIEGRVKWTSLVVMEDREMMKEYHRLRRIDPDLAPKEYDCHFIARSGNIVDIRIKMDMIPGTSTSVATLIDVTEKKKMEKSLIARKAELSAIVENFPGYIYTTLEDYRIEFMNRMLVEKIGGIHPDAPCYNVLFSFHEPCPWCGHENVFRGETIRSEFRDPADERWYAMISTPIFDVDGKVRKRQTIQTDITDQKRAEERLKASASILKEENLLLKQSMKDRYQFGNIVGKSSKMQKVYELILKAAASESSVIVYGESGTGKELVAKEIHRLGKRRDKPFIPVNCGAIPENLMESEFFGYRKGAFTGATVDKKGYLELAEGGTLFLDELGEIGQSMQVKLLRALEGGGYIPLGGKTIKKPDIKIIAATNRNLLELVNQEKIREDFYYRIHVIPIYLPPLRNRKSDIPLLIEHFMKSRVRKGNMPELDSTVIDAFLKYDWPGNIRELQNALNRYFTLGSVEFIHNSSSTRRLHVSGKRVSTSAVQTDLRTALAEVERELIQKKLTENLWHRGNTAKALGVNRRTLERRIAIYGLNSKS